MTCEEPAHGGDPLTDELEQLYQSTYTAVVRFLYRATEPVLRPVRHRLPTLAMGLDLSPMVVILALYFLKEFLVPVLHRLAMTLEIG